jgi:hypothetical protein
LEDIKDYQAVVGSLINAALASRPDISSSNSQPIVDYISTAMASASASASAAVFQGTQIPTRPMTARTVNLREAMCFSPVMERSHGSLESKASSPCQLSRPSASPARGIVNCYYVNTDENMADILTKALNKDKHMKFMKQWVCGNWRSIGG